MYTEKRTDSAGNVYYSFTYIDEDGKRRRLKKSEHPHFIKREDAEAWASSQQAYREAKKDEIRRKLAWKSTYYNFDELVDKYKQARKEQAPRSWKASATFLEQHVLPWFLNEKRLDNLNYWCMHFAEYRDFLRGLAESGRLTYASCNRAIQALNTFISTMGDYHLMDLDAAKRCKGFPKHMENTKGIESVVTEPEFLNVKKALAAVGEDHAEFFHVLYHTGMRFNELYSLPMSALFAGKLDGSLGDELNKAEIRYAGYVVLESQNKYKWLIRNEDGSVDRVPLKNRKTISAKNSRVVPITDKETWNILARRHKAQNALRSRSVYGESPINYQLFSESVKSSTLKSKLREVYEKLPYSRKTHHDLRHSYCTYLVGRTRNFFLAQSILGHKSEVFWRYMHLHEKITQEAKMKTQEIEEIDFDLDA